MLEFIESPLFKNWHIIKQWSWVLRPKHDKTCVLVRNVAANPIERVCPSRVASHIEAVKKPIGIKRRYVGAATSRHENGNLHIHKFTILTRQFLFIPSCHNCSYLVNKYYMCQRLICRCFSKVLLRVSLYLSLMIVLSVS